MKTAQPTSAAQGFIYALICPSQPDLVKVGCSIYHPLDRVRQLSASTSTALPFVLAYHRKVAFPFAVESRIHLILDEYRVNDSREFFRLPLHEVIKVMDTFEEIRNAEVKTPFAELFASFDQDGPDELTEDERAQCRALERRIR